MTEAMPFLRKLITFLWPPDIRRGPFAARKHYVRLLSRRARGA